MTGIAAVAGNIDFRDSDQTIRRITMNNANNNVNLNGGTITIREMPAATTYLGGFSGSGTVLYSPAAGTGMATISLRKSNTSFLGDIELNATTSGDFTVLNIDDEDQLPSLTASGTVANRLTYQAAVTTLTPGSSSRTITLNGPLEIETTTGPLTIQRLINGTGGTLTKSGANTLTLSSPSSNTIGTLDIEQGQVTVSSFDDFGGSVQLANGTTIFSTGAVSQTTGTIIPPSSGSATVNLSGGNWVLDNPLGTASSNGTLTKAGTSDLTLNAASLHPGPINITDGSITGNNSATIVTNPINPASALTIGAGNTYTTGTNNPQTFANSISGTGTLSISNGSTVTFDSGFSPKTVPVIVTGGGNVVVQNTTANLTNNLNDYTGQTNIGNNGTLEIIDEQPISGTSLILYNGGTLDVTGAGVTITKDHSLSVASQATVNNIGAVTLSGQILAGSSNTVNKTGAGALSLTGSANTINNLNIAGGSVIVSDFNKYQGNVSLGNGTTFRTTGAITHPTGSTINAPVTAGNSATFQIDADYTLTDPLSSSLTSGTLNKSGSGNLTLNSTSGLNNHQGPINILAGEITSGATNAINPNSELSIALGAVFDLNGNEQTLNSITGTGTGDLNINGGILNFGSDTGGLEPRLLGNGTINLNATNVTLENSGNAFNGGFTLTNLSSLTVESPSELGPVATISLQDSSFIVSSDTPGTKTFTTTITGAGGNNIIDTRANTAVNIVPSLNQASGTLTKSGSGLLSLNSATNNINELSIDEGTVNVGGFNGDVNLSDNTTYRNSAPVTHTTGTIFPSIDGTSTLDIGPTYTLSNSLGVTNSLNPILNKTGLGDLILLVPANFSGNLAGTTPATINIQQGTIQSNNVTPTNNTLNPDNNINISSGASYITNNGNQTFTRTLTGSGVVNYGSGDLNIQVNNPVASGVMDIDSELIGSGDLTLNSPNANGYRLTNSSNAISGRVIVQNNELFVDDASTLGTASEVQLNNSTLRSTSVNIARPIALNGGGTFDNNGVSPELSGGISGTGPANFVGSGNLTLDSASITYTGNSNVNAGTLILDNATTLPANTLLNLNGGDLRLASTNSATTHTFANIIGSGTFDNAGAGAKTLELTPTTGGTYSGVISSTGGGNIDINLNGPATTSTTWTGVHTFTGDINVNNGIELRIGNTTGSAANANVFVNNGGTFGGDGQINDLTINGGTYDPGNSIETQNIGGDYTHSTGTLTIEIANPTAQSTNPLPTNFYDRILVAGNANITGGNINIQQDGGSNEFQNGNVFPFLQVSGTLTDNNIFENNFTPSMIGCFQVIVENNGPNILQVRLALQALSGAGATGPAGTLADHLDSIFPTSTGALRNLIDNLNMVDMAELSNALNQLHAANFNQFTQASLSNTADCLHTAAGYTYNIHPPTRGHHNVWGKVYGSAFFNESDVNTFEYDNYTAGAIYGMDHTISSDITLGILFGYNYQRGKWHCPGSKAHAHSITTGLYGSWTHGLFFAEGALSLSLDSFDYDRKVEFHNLMLNARSQHYGYHLGSHLAGGMDLLIDWLHLRPYMGIDYLFMHEEGYQESEAPGANLGVAARNSDQLRSEVGLIAGADIINRGGWTWSASLKAAYNNVVNLSDGHVVQSFESNRGINLIPLRPTRHIFKTGATLSAIPANLQDWQFDLHYEAELTNRSHGHKVSLRGTKSF